MLGREYGMNTKRNEGANITARTRRIGFTLLTSIPSHLVLPSITRLLLVIFFSGGRPVVRGRCLCRKVYPAMSAKMALPSRVTVRSHVPLGSTPAGNTAAIMAAAAAAAVMVVAAAAVVVAMVVVVVARGGSQSSWR